MTIPIAPYVEMNASPVPTVTPFNFRDGVTYLEKLETIQLYINRILVPYINGLQQALTPEQLQAITNTVLQQSVKTITIVTGTEVRPITSAAVLWIGGQIQPSNMLPGDIWFAAVPTVPVAPIITTTALPGLTVGVFISQALAADGTNPKSFSVTSGTLPAGLTLNVNGVLSGAPLTAGSYTFTVTCSNSAGTDTQVYTGTIAATLTAPVITTTLLNAMTQNAAFTQVLNYTGSTVTSVSVVTGALPSGMTLVVNAGVITLAGTPTAAGAFAFTAQATNTIGSDTQAYSGTVAPISVSTEVSVFSNTVPAVLTTFEDASTDSWTSHQFYVPSSGASMAANKIVGGRLYVPAGSAHIGKAWQTALYRQPTKIWDTDAGIGLNNIFETNGTKISGAPLVEGWNEARFPVEYDCVPNNGGWFIGVKIGSGGTGYLHNNSLNPASIKAPGQNFYLSEKGTSAGEGRRSFYRDTSSSASWYGIDTIVKIP